MARRKQNSKDLFRNMKGWEKQYLKKSIAYGHLVGEDGKKEVRVKIKSTEL